MPRTNEGTDYLVNLLTSQFTYGSIGSQPPLMFVGSANAEPVSASSPGLGNGGSYDAGGGSRNIPGIVSHTTGASSFVLMSPDTVAGSFRTMYKVAICIDQYLDTTINTSMVYLGLTSVPMPINTGDHYLFAVTITI